MNRGPSRQGNIAQLKRCATKRLKDAEEAQYLLLSERSEAAETACCALDREPLGDEPSRGGRSSRCWQRLQGDGEMDRGEPPVRGRPSFPARRSAGQHQRVRGRLQPRFRRLRGQGARVPRPRVSRCGMREPTLSRAPTVPWYLVE